MSTIKLFISYSGNDGEIADSFHELLRAALPVSPKEIRSFTLPSGALSPGANIHETLRTEAVEADVMIALLSKYSLQSNYVQFELGARWGSGKPLIPVLVKGTDPQTLEEPIRVFNAAKVSGPASIHELLVDIARNCRLKLYPVSSFQRQLDTFLAVNAAPEQITKPIQISKNLADSQALLDSAVQILTKRNFMDDEVREYIGRLADLARHAIHPEIAWLDVMQRMTSKEAFSLGLKPLCNSIVSKTNEWLAIIFSEIPRNSPPRLIPIWINNEAFCGSGAAFACGGIDYVDRLTERIDPAKYGISPGPANEIAHQYEVWEKSHHFSSIAALAIPNGPGTSRSVGVLNMNFARPYPFGKNEVMPPQMVSRIRQTFEPHLLIIGHILICNYDSRLVPKVKRR